jgi:hypothetical protein
MVGIASREEMVYKEWRCHDDPRVDLRPGSALGFGESTRNILN